MAPIFPNNVPSHYPEMNLPYEKMLSVWHIFGDIGAKGQFISKANFHLNQKLTENISLFLPQVFKMGQIKKRIQIIILDDK